MNHQNQGRGGSYTNQGDERNWNQGQKRYGTQDWNQSGLATGSMYGQSGRTGNQGGYPDEYATGMQGSRRGFDAGYDSTDDLLRGYGQGGSYSGGYQGGYGNQGGYQGYQGGYQSDEGQYGGYQSGGQGSRGYGQAGYGQNQWGQRSQQREGYGQMGYGQSREAQRNYGNQYQYPGGYSGGYGSQSGNHGSQGYGNQGYGSQGYGNQGYGGQGHSSSERREQFERDNYRNDYSGGMQSAGRGLMGGSDENYSGPTSGQYGFQGGYADSGRSGSMRGSAPKNYKKSDDRVRDDVSERLVNEGYDCSDMEVNCQNGIVTLTGEVCNRDVKHGMERSASNVHGVQDVQNQMRVKGRQSGEIESKNWSSGSGSSGSGSSGSSSSGTSGSSYGGSSGGSLGGQTGAGASGTTGANRGTNAAGSTSADSWNDKNKKS